MPFTLTLSCPSEASLAGIRPSLTAPHLIAQGYFPQMAYATPAYGMPAAASQLAQAVRHQIEYYVSLENLVRDLFLRAKMDSDGWIPLSIIAGFNRVRVMTSDVALIATSLLRSPVAELSPDVLMVILPYHLKPLQSLPDHCKPSISRSSTGYVIGQLMCGIY